MREKKFVLGLAPTRRDTRDFDLKYAYENKAAIQKRVEEIVGGMENVEVVNIDFLSDEGLLVFPEQAQRVADYFREKKVDAVFAPHCNFGAEEPVAKLGRLMGKPFLLWGPRDQMPPPSGPRQTDTQCGLFATGMILDRYNVPFTYLPNCWMDDARLEEGLKRFIAAANVVKAIGALRIGQISLRPRTFSSVKVNENQLLEQFGIEVVTIDTVEITGEICRILEEAPAALAEDVENMKRRFDASAMSEDELRGVAALKLAVVYLAEKYQLSAFASECWKTFSAPFGIYPCSAFGDLIEMGIPMACEGDIYGAISSVILDAAAMGNEPHFLADLTIRHPLNDNAELLWHCGPFPRALAREDCRPKLAACMGNFELKKGEMTLARFGESHGKFKLFYGEGKACDGPSTNGTYVWFEAKDWEAWERKLVMGPYIHHISGVYGRYGEILREACRYLNGVEADPADE